MEARLSCTAGEEMRFTGDSMVIKLVQRAGSPPFSSSSYCRRDGRAEGSVRKVDHYIIAMAIERCPPLSISLVKTSSPCVPIGCRGRFNRGGT
ncbi:hypothetical protein SRHO_G00325220 [Serrasalmus rhombeus]